MGQAEVQDFLEGKFKTEPDRYFTASEMAKVLDITTRNIRVSLLRLRRYGEVEVRTVGHPTKGGREISEYRYKKSDSQKDELKRI